MPIEGSTVHRALRRELDVAQDEVQQHRGQATRLEARLRELAEERGRALLELARFSLPEMSRPAVERSLDHARKDLLALLGEKERHETGLRSRRDQAVAEVRRLETRLESITRNLNEKVQQRERLEAEVAAALKQDPEFVERSQLAATAEADLHRDEERVQEIQQEAQSKLPAFQESRLFQYLLRRGYGTPDYPHRGLIRDLDRWIARLIQFPKAKVAYEFLTSTPSLVEAEVKRRRELFEQLMDQVEALEKACSDRLGLTAVLEEGDRLGAERDQLVSTLEDQRRKAAALEREIAEMSLPDNLYYRQGLERLQAILARTESAVLELRARQTPEPQDDALVARVRNSEQEVSRLRTELARLNDRRKIADRYAEGLQELAQRFQQANYDSVRSTFSNRLDLSPLLEGMRRGDLSVAKVWGELASAQHFEPHQLQQYGAPMIEVLGSPQGRILIDAIGGVLGEAMREAGRRGVQRRGGGGWSIPTMPSPMSMPRPQSRPAPVRPSAPRTRPGGFTSGEGF